MSQQAWQSQEYSQYAVLGGGGLNGGVLPVAMVGWVRAGFEATRATGMATTVGLLLGVGVFLAGGGGLTGGTWLERAGETAAAIANGKSAIVAGGGDDDGEWGRTATLGIPRCPTAAERAALHRSCLQDSQKKKFEIIVMDLSSSLSQGGFFVNLVISILQFLYPLFSFGSFLFSSCKIFKSLSLLYFSGNFFHVF